MLISHQEIPFAFDLKKIKNRLILQKNLCLPLDETFDLVDQLAQFELGRFLLTNKGLNGFWTAYAILYAKNKTHLSSLESWLVHQAPAFLATQERFHIFQKEILKRLKQGMHIASLPCGLMEDLLSLPSQALNKVSITGIDLDKSALKQAQQIAEKRQVTSCQFIMKDAWNLDLEEQFDLITSNGLNIYEPNTEKLNAFYSAMAKALKPGGILISSYLAHPQDPDRPAAQKSIDPKTALKQQAIFQDIIQAKWQCVQTANQIRQQLLEAGFYLEETIYDSRCLFPTIIANKASS